MSKVRSVFAALCFSLLVGSVAAFVDYGGAGGGGGGSGSGDIEGVTAGTNLNGGGASGSVTLNLDDEIELAGPSFSVGTSTFAVSLGKVGIGTTAPTDSLEIVLPSRAAPGQSGGMLFRSDAEDAVQLILRATDSLSGLYISYLGPSFPSGAGWGKIAPIGTLDGIQINGQSLTVKTNSLVGVGTTAPSYRLHVTTNAGNSNTVFAVSTGTVDLFAVHGTSVSLEVPLVFPDGTVQASAAAAGTGDIESVTAGANLTGGGTSGAVTLNVADNIALTSGTFSGDVTVYGAIKGGSGNAVLSSTPSIVFYANTGRYEVNLSTFVIPGSIGTATNPNLLLFGSTVTTFSTPVKSTGNVRAANIGLAQWIIHLSSDTLAAGCTYFMGEAPSDTSITILKTRAKTYSVAASSANYGLQEKTDTNVNGTWLHTGTYSTATWAGGTPVTSFADSSIAAGNGVYLVTKAGGATAGTPRGLTVIVDFKYDNP